MLLEECSLSRCAERPKCGPTALRPARAASRIVVTIAETSSRREMQDKWPCPLERRVLVPGRCVLLAGHPPSPRCDGKPWGQQRRASAVSGRAPRARLSQVAGRSRQLTEQGAPLGTGLASPRCPITDDACRAPVGLPGTSLASPRPPILGKHTRPCPACRLAGERCSADRSNASLIPVLSLSFAMKLKNFPDSLPSKVGVYSFKSQAGALGTRWSPGPLWMSHRVLTR